MPVFDARDLVSFPANGNNASDVVFGGVHFNLTTLEHWNYTLYSNGTLTNGSKCWLTFAPYQPTLLYPNGTFINATSCYSPINPIGVRAKTGIGFAVTFGLMLLLTLMCLRKHGRLYLPATKRFRPVGRRWQWYWGILTSVAALISLFMTIDVDRYFLPELPIVLTSFFWYLLQMCAMALVWEAIRHWGSWQERQVVDPNPFALPQDDRRARFELLIPLVFYLFVWLNFFLVVPRPWGKIEKQRSAEQTADIAAQAATDARFKVATFCLVAAWITTVVSLYHSISHYLPRHRGLVNRTVGFVASIPPRFFVLLLLAAAMIAYQGLCAWHFQWSPLMVKGDRVAIYMGGYLPELLILVFQIVYGWISPNEDRELIRQRRARGSEIDRDLGLVKKPAWWRRLNSDYVAAANGTMSMRDRIARNVGEIGGGRATTRGIDTVIANRAADAEAAQSQGLEMSPLARTASNATRAASYAAKGDGARANAHPAVVAVADMLFPRVQLTEAPPPPYNADTGTAPSSTLSSTPTLDVSRGRSRDDDEHGADINRSTSTNTTNTTGSLAAPPQQVRSMLDV